MCSSSKVKHKEKSPWELNYNETAAHLKPQWLQTLDDQIFNVKNYYEMVRNKMRNHKTEQGTIFCLKNEYSDLKKGHLEVKNVRHPNELSIRLLILV